MTWEMIFVLALLALVLVAFIAEWAGPDQIAMSALVLLFLAGILSVEQAISVFSNSAPVTIGAMFIMTAALEKTGVIDQIGHFLTSRLGNNPRTILLATALLAGTASAFVNNTPIVAMFMPILLGLARSKDIAASKLLIPLSYACIMGGMCTLIGTSTNILVSGIAKQSGLEPLSMFELAWVGLPLFLFGLAYMTALAPLMLPERQSVTSVLSPEERKQFFCQVLVKKDSPMVGQALLETALAKRKTEFKIVEVRRDGRRLLRPLSQIQVRAYDRIMIAASSRSLAEIPDIEGVTLPTQTQGELGIESLSTIQGAIVEGIIAPHSNLIGRTIRQINFRQTYGMLILAIHREGKNLSSKFLDERLAFGDTILMMGPTTSFAELSKGGDFMLLEDKLPKAYRRKLAPVAIASIAGVVVVSSLGWLPIVGAALVGSLVVLLTRCLDAREAYDAVDWQILFLIYGMLAVGLAMQTTGTAEFLARTGVDVIDDWVPAAWLPFVVLSFCYLLTSTLTEFLSNNATAVVMAPIAIGFAASMGVDPRPFIIAVALAASAAFVTPIGYQTNTMVYGVGGYRFTDFVKFGLPLNIVFWLAASVLIPWMWAF